MTAFKQDIERWLKEGKDKGATHVIIALDTFDHDNYPVFVFAHEDIKKCVKTIKSESMQSVNEVYNLSMDINAQLSAPHVWNT
jgi:hypothetical protein